MDISVNKVELYIDIYALFQFKISASTASRACNCFQVWAVGTCLCTGNPWPVHTVPVCRTHTYSVLVSVYGVCVGRYFVFPNANNDLISMLILGINFKMKKNLV